MEVRVNTRATMHQSAIIRAETSSAPFLDPAVLTAAMMKVEAVDGASGVHEAFVERYGMSREEAIAWQRHLGQIWSVLNADRTYGDREKAEGAMRYLLRFPDNRTYLENAVIRADLGYLLDEVPIDDEG
jgi:hypothetical protein